MTSGFVLIRDNAIKIRHQKGLTDPSSSTVNLVQFIPLRHGQYTVQAKVKKVSGTPDMWIQVQCNGTTVNSPSSVNQLTEDDFITVSVSFSNSSSSWKYAAVFFICSGGEVLLDEAELNTNENKIVHLLKYGTVNADYVAVRSAGNANAPVIARVPQNRKMVLLETDDYNWLECRCKLANSPYVGTGYIMRSCISNLCNADDPDDYCYEYPDARLAAVGKAEEGINKNGHHIQEFYSPNLTSGKWCHYFADWLSAVCYWGSISDSHSSVPFVGNCRDGILWFLNNSAFTFTTAAQKAKLRSFSDFSSLISSDDLSTDEASYEPEVGDYVYFASSNPAEAAQHVAVVIDVKSDGQIEIVEGNYDGMSIAYSRTISPDIGGAGNIVGFGSPLNRGVG